MDKFDLIIHGGGMVGASTALSLANSGLSVLVIERAPQPVFHADLPMQLRVSAINLASEALLQQLDVWQDIVQLRACPYRYLGVWEQPDCKVRFDASEIGRDHLGHIVENTVIQHALWQACLRHPAIETVTGASICTMTQADRGVTIALDSGAEYQGRILVGADGAVSRVRELAGIGLTGWDYGQHALVVAIDIDSPQQDITWQQFFPSGPRAFLPLSGSHASLVWYDDAQRITELQQLTPEALQQAIASHFPEELPPFSVDRYSSFPLTRRHANNYVAGRVVLLGDAAHTINPLAGQGVNLGLRDVEVFCRAIAGAIEAGQPWDNEKVLRRYTRQRRPHNSAMISAMDALYAVFSNEVAPISLARNSGLKLAANLKPARIAATRYACGLF